MKVLVYTRETLAWKVKHASLPYRILEMTSAPLHTPLCSTSSDAVFGATTGNIKRSETNSLTSRASLGGREFSQEAPIRTPASADANNAAEKLAGSVADMIAGAGMETGDTVISSGAIASAAAHTAAASNIVADPITMWKSACQVIRSRKRFLAVLVRVSLLF